MPATARRSWRTRPEYRGFCSDGYFLDRAGRLRFQRDPRGAIDVAKAKLDLLLLDDIPRLPAVQAVAIGGRWPRPGNVEAVRQAIERIPLRFRYKWLAAGGRIEVLPGAVLSDSRWLGVNKFHSAIAKVAGDHPDAPQTARHEFAHGLDYALGYPSHSAEWLKIWQNATAAGRVPRLAGQREKPEEFFAEQFGNLWHPQVFITSQAAQDFIMGLV